MTPPLLVVLLVLTLSAAIPPEPVVYGILPANPTGPYDKTPPLLPQRPAPAAAQPAAQPNAQPAARPAAQPSAQPAARQGGASPGVQRNAGGFMQRSSPAAAPAVPSSPGRPEVPKTNPPKQTRQEKRAAAQVEKTQREINKVKERLDHLEKSIQDRTGGRKNAEGTRVVTGESRKENIRQSHEKAVMNARLRAQSLGEATTTKGKAQLEKAVLKLEKQRDAALASVEKDVTKANRAIDKIRGEREKLQTKHAAMAKKLAQQQQRRAQPKPSPNAKPKGR